MSRFNFCFRYQRKSATEATLMNLQDELLVEIYRFLDSKSLTNLMVTCKRNYNVVNEFVPPTYYVDDKMIKNHLKSAYNSDRNFRSLSIKMSRKRFQKLSFFLKKIGKSVRSSDVKLFTYEMYPLNQILKLCPLREKLRVEFFRTWNDIIFFTNPKVAMENLREFSLCKSFDSFYHHETYVDLSLFRKSKLEKLTLESIKVKNSATDEEISNSKWKLNELKVKDCVVENFGSFVELVKLQTNLRCVQFKLKEYKEEKFQEFKDFLDFVLNLPSLKILKLTLPENEGQFFPSNFINTSIELLEIEKSIINLKKAP